MAKSNFNPSISVERMAAYIDGNLNPMDMRDVFIQLSTDDNMSNIANMAFDSGSSGSTDYMLTTPDETSLLQHDLPVIDGVMGSQFDTVLLHENQLDSSFLGQLTPDDIQQKYPDTCAIKSQQIILESHDIHVTEDQLVRESIANGWYVPGEGGTAPKDVGNLLENHGVHATRYIHGSVADIASELAEGHQVIVGVDSGELWSPGVGESIEDFFNSAGADHALIVSGIVVNPITSEQEVVLTDPGTGEVMHTYTVEQFQDAWNDSDNFMVVAE